MSNMEAGNFELYSTNQDELDGTNAWKYCNYDYHGIGFSRDCGPYDYLGNQWNSYVKYGHGDANHHGYNVEKP